MASTGKRTSKASKSSNSKKDKQPAKAPQKEEVIPFIAWFQKSVNKGQLNYWQESEIGVFFKEKGLKDSENPEKYEEILKLY